MYVYTGSTDSRDMLGYMARKLVESCKVSSGGTTSRSLASLESNSFAPDDPDTGKTETRREKIKRKRRNSVCKNNYRAFAEPRTFGSFLQQHINLAFARGFDDNVSRHSIPAHFEVDVVYDLLIRNN